MKLKTFYQDMGSSYNAKSDEIKYELSRHFSDEFKHNGFAITLQ
jgi:hypothetical protein